MEVSGEIVRLVSFRFGKTDRCACVQSRYSVESCVSQNSRSSASFLNTGISLRLLFINGTFLSVHIPCRNDADQGLRLSERKSDVKQATRVCLSQGMEPLFSLAVFGIGRQQQRSIEEYLLGLPLGDAVLVILG